MASTWLPMRLVCSLLVLTITLDAADPGCKGTLYLTLDTGSMKPAQEIREILRKHQVRATFFMNYSLST